MHMNVLVTLQSHDRIEVCVDSQHNTLKSIQARGCLDLLILIEELRKQIGIKLEKLTVPEGNEHYHMLIREALLKAQKLWKLPYEEDELCHCRKVETSIVDAAIVLGAHTVEQVSYETSAGTACGSCRPNTQKIINYRKTGS